MFGKIVFFISLNLVFCKDCYWNSKCPYDLFSTKTPYESVRGDVRDAVLPGCEPVSLWSLHRHGNRNPDAEVTREINELQRKIINAINTGTQFTACSQDKEDLLAWTWNTTLESAPKYLTGIGYEELHNIGKRIRQRFSTLLSVSDKFYFRPTNEQRTITSAIAFVHGLTHGTEVNLTANIDDPWEVDEVLRPYENCAKYQKEVKKSQVLVDELYAYDSSPEVLAVRDRAQKILGANYELTVADTYNVYELCRFHRSWSPNLRSPWCLFFTNKDLEVLEYRDDVRHYYRNGYGSQINVNLGGAPLKDLYEKFKAATLNTDKNIVSYFTHDTMFEMVLSALSLYKDEEPLKGSTRNHNRLWRTSKIAAFSANLIAVLFKCQEDGNDVHRVQFLINEKLTPLCSERGCTWREFEDRFQIFTNFTMEFCSNENSMTITSSEVKLSIMNILLLLPLLLIFG